MQDEELMEELVQPALRAMGRIDAGATPFLARSLEQFLSREYEVPLEELPIVNGAVMDFRDDVDPWAKTFTSTIVDGAGVAEFYDSYSQSGMPMASICSEEFTRRVHTAALGYEFSVEDIGFEGLASRNRQPVRLRDRLRRHSVRGMLELAERTFMWGDSARDVYGFANHPNVTEVARSGPAWTLASGEEIIQDITNMYQAVRDNTLCTREPNALMIPERVWTNWTRPYTTTSGPTVVTSTSIREAVQRAFPQITMGSLCRLQADKSFGNLSEGRAVMYRRDPDELAAVYPMRPRFLAPQAVELMLKVPGYNRHGGVDWPGFRTACYTNV